MANTPRANLGVARNLTPASLVEAFMEGLNAELVHSNPIDPELAGIYYVLGQTKLLLQEAYMRGARLQAMQTERANRGKMGFNYGSSVSLAQGQIAAAKLVAEFIENQPRPQVNAPFPPAMASALSNWNETCEWRYSGRNPATDMVETPHGPIPAEFAVGCKYCPTCGNFVETKK